MEQLPPTQKPCAPGLYLVATPIGNLGDITRRALEVLHACDILLCEDTRVTRKLLAHYGIRAKSLKSYHDHNGHEMRPKVRQWIAEGQAVALVSDAGTPLISDPGYKLVTTLHQAQLPVFALPGACAGVNALVLSGLPPDRFLFLGFLPRQTKAAREILQSVKDLPVTLVIYESALRLPVRLKQLFEVLGARPTAAVREMTKLHEQIRHFSLGAAPEDLTLKGEYVLVIAAGDGKPEISEAEVIDMLREAGVERSLKTAVSAVAKQTGLPRREVYRLGLTLKP